VTVDPGGKVVCQAGQGGTARVCGWNGRKVERVNRGDLTSIDGASPECWEVGLVRSQSPHSSDEPRNKVTGGAKAGQEGGCVKTRSKELQPALVFEETMQVGKASRKGSAEPSIWTERMLTTLGNGVRGGKWYSLGDKAFSVKALDASFARVKANKGSCGVDGWTVERFDSARDENFERMHSELMAGTYRPSAVRRVWIPKPGSKEKRPLGIPTVRDRTVQTAIKLAVEPIFEMEFRDSSFGFRPGRSCKQALSKVRAALRSGKQFVVDADFRKFFDTIPHEVIMRGLETKVSDGKILSVVRAYLAQGVMDGGVLMPEDEETEAGTPQGSPLSPLLANIALHGLDVLLEDSGYEIVRYADDFVVMCQSRELADEALEAVKNWSETNGLNLHPEKTRIVDHGSGESFEFLGFEFRKDTFFPRKKSIVNIRGKIRDKTPRLSGTSIKPVIAALNPVLKGWFRYFRPSPKHVFRGMDGYVRRRLRSLLDRRRGIQCTHPKRESHKRWPNAFFAEHGLYSMEQAWEEWSILSKANH
jgi:RNA-directed DNA polymerase